MQGNMVIYHEDSGRKDTSRRRDVGYRIEWRRLWHRQQETANTQGLRQRRTWRRQSQANRWREIIILSSHKNFPVVVNNVYGHIKRKDIAMTHNKEHMEDLKEKAVHAKEKLAEDGKQLQEKIAEGAEKTKEKAHEMKEKIKDKAHDVKEKVAEKVDDAKFKAHEMKDKMAETGENLRSKGREVKEKVTEKTNEMKNKKRTA